MSLYSLLNCFPDRLSGNQSRLVAENLICSPYIVLFLHYSHLEVIWMFQTINSSETDEEFQKQVETFGTYNLPKQGWRLLLYNIGWTSDFYFFVNLGFKNISPCMSLHYLSTSKNQQCVRITPACCLFLHRSFRKAF